MTAGELTDALREALACFEGAGPLTTTEVADRLDLGRRSTYERLERLVERDALQTKKVGASARVWWRSTGPASADPSATAAWPADAGPLVDDVLAEADVGAFVLDDSFRVAWVNETATRYFGLDREAVLGADKRALVADRVAPAVEDSEGFAETVLGTYERNERAERFECHVTPGDGRDERWLEHRSEPIESGAYAGGRLELYDDLTEQRRLEGAARSDREQFETLVEAVDEYAIFLLDPEGRVRTWNPGARRIKGYEADEIVGEHVSTFHTEENRADGVPAANLAAAAADGAVEDEGWRVRADGSRFWATVSLTAIRGDDGELAGYAKVTRDMTARREYERRLEEQAGRLARQRDDLERELDDVFDRVDDAFFAVDDDWRFTFVNDAAVDVLGLSAGDLVGVRVWDALPEVADGHLRARAERAMETQESAEFDFYAERREVWIEARLYPSADGLSVYFRDVTEQKERERELERQASLLDTLFEQIPVNLYVKDEEARHVRTSTPYLREEYPEEEWFRGKTDLDIYPEELAAEAYADDLRVIEEGESVVEKLEYDPVDEEWLLTSKVPWRDDEGEVCGLIGVTRYVTEQKERERELERRVRQQEVVAELGQRALEERDPDALVADATELVAETLDTETCAVLDLDADADELLLRQGVGWDPGVVGEATVSAVDEDSQAAHTLDAGEPVRVADLDTETRFVGPDQLTSAEVRSGVSVVIGPEYDPWGVLGTHDTDPGEFSDRDVAFVQSVANVLATAIRRHDDEQALVRQGEQLAALNNLNEVVHDVTDAVIDQSTREEVERAVCERLADADSYAFAWIGDVDTASRTVEPRAEAGVDGYLDGVTISVDPDDDRSVGPTGQAVLTREIQTTGDVQTDPAHEPWREHVTGYGIRSSAAIPIVHGDSLFGVLNVYAERPGAFEGRERAVIARLGEVVGHAIAAAERKRALLSDEVVELEYRVGDVLERAGVADDASGRVHFEHAVPLEGDEYLVYGHASADGVATLERLAESQPGWTDVTFHGADGETTFELRVADPPVLSVLASVGGSLADATIEDGACHVTLHLSPGTDVRRMTDAIEAAYPSAELLRRRLVSRPSADVHRGRRVLDGLTDRQRTAVEAAHYAGFFEWPRETSGGELADSLGVSSPTFHQHLRKAEKRVFEALLSPTDASV